MNFRKQFGGIATTIAAIVPAVIIMVAFPLMMMAEQTDEATKLEAQVATEEILNEIITTGIVTQEQLDNYELTLGATEIPWEWEITIQRVDGNPAKKTTGDTSIDSTTSYTEYKTQFLEEMTSNSGIVTFNEGDFVYLKATCDGSWIQTLFGTLGITSNSNYVEASGMVTKSGE